MKNSIILEGPNGSGKSTLGRFLAQRMGVEYEHAGPSPGSEENNFMACSNQLQLLKDGCILDRCTPISEIVYGTNSPEHAQDLSIWGQRMFEQALVVYCTGQGKFKKKDYYPEGHYERVVEERRSIRRYYSQLMAAVPHIKYNFEEDTSQSILRCICYERIHSA